MPGSAASLVLTDAYRRRLLELRDLVTAQVVDGWSMVDPTDLRGTFPRWLRLATALLTAGQQQAITMTNAWTAAYFASELGARAEAPTRVDTADVAGRTRDGRPVGDVLRTSLVSSLVASGQGRPPLTSGVQRAVRTTRTEVLEAARTTLHRTMDDDSRVTGYRRVTSGTPCGACLALTREMRTTDRRLEIHGHCRCTAEPVLSGVRETAHRPTGRDLFDRLDPATQDRVYGPDVAAAIRGGVDLDQLVTRTEGPQWGTSVSQTPASKLA